MNGCTRSARTRARWFFLLALIGLPSGGCDYEGEDPLTGPDLVEADAPRNLVAEATWVLEGWQGVQPVGHYGVNVLWEIPTRWDGQPFRVYSRRSNESSYFLVGTVTSCADGLCRYTDLNVAPGQRYAYYVAAVDERRNRDLAPSRVVDVAVPPATTPEPPAAPRVRALDGAVYLTWESTGAQRYLVFLERIDSDSVFFQVGETDGTSFLDERVENGSRYAYRIAAVDTLGPVSRRSALGSGVPRPDYHAELLYAHADSAPASGFRFREAETEDPIVPGNAAEAQWRLEAIAGVLSIRPLGETRVTAGVFTTALTCGPASEPDCEAIDEAPASSAFGSGPVPVEAGSTYVFQVRGDDGRTHYAKVRVQGSTTNQSGKRVVIFDWAYQLRPEERSLNRLPG